MGAFELGILFKALCTLSYFKPAILNILSIFMHLLRDNIHAFEEHIMHEF